MGTKGPFDYELGHHSFKVRDRVRIPDGLPFFRTGSIKVMQ